MKESHIGASAFQVATTYIGTIVGAGFASGQEALRFFGAYGKYGLIGIALSTALFCAYGILVMELGSRMGARTHQEILYRALGPTLGRIMDMVITLFLGATLTVMVAGGGAIFAEQVGLPHTVGTLVTACLTGLTVLAGMRGLLAANTVVVPMLILAVSGLSVAAIHFHGIGPVLDRATFWPFLAPVRSWVLAAWLYAGYNLVLSISVLAPLGAAARDRRSIIVGGLFGGIVLGMLATGITLAIGVHMPEIGTFEIPMLFLARLHPRLVQWLYTFILWAEIYTTAISCAYGFATRVAVMARKSYRNIVVVATAIALFGSGFGFSTLLSRLYPLFGFVALVVLFGLGLLPFRRRVPTS